MIPKPVAIHMMPYIVSTGYRRPRSMLAKSVIRTRLMTGQLSPLPSFIIIGAQRGGTTSLYDLLLGHPNVYPALVKEVQYFDKHYANGHDWYRANFAPHLHDTNNHGAAAQITGEATPNYLFHPQAPRRIFDVAPNAKLIVLLRNPVDRAYSHYNLMKVQGAEHVAFEQAIELEEERTRDDRARLLADANFYARSLMRYSYAAKGIYADQLPAWMELYPKDRLLILQSEALYTNTSQVLQRVTDFLGLPQWEPNISKEHRKLAQPRITSRGLAKPATHATTRAYLSAFFRTHNERLFDLLGEEYDWGD